MKKSGKKEPETRPIKRSAPARSPEARENQMIALAERLAEEQLRNGTASSQVITHYLKLGTMKDRLERENLQEEIKLKKAKTEALETSKNIESLYANAIKAMRTYSGYDEPEEEEPYEE